MAMQTLYRLQCDEEGCGQIQGVVSVDRNEARDRARSVGWDVGPHYTETRSGRVTHHTDFCPRHRRTPQEG